MRPAWSFGLAVLTASAPVAAAEPFAAQLARVAPPTLASEWPAIRENWQDLAQATAATRQQRRWHFALSALHRGEPEQALGALTVMADDEADLRFAPYWALARGRALIELGRHAEGLANLDSPSLRGNSESCAWRLRALSALAAAVPALQQMPCARAALGARTPTQRSAFLHAAADMALLAGKPKAALHWLQFVPRDQGAAVRKGEALLAEGRPRDAIAVLRDLASSAAGPLRVRAAAAFLEAELAAGAITPAAALVRAEALRFGWRGDRLERRLALLCWDLSLKAGRPRSSLAAAAVLLRHHPGEPRLPAILGVVVAAFDRWLDSRSGVPLPLAAGLLWDHRDLLPNDGRGDLIVRRLAARLGGEGLFARAAELLDHQREVRATDVAQGPLSISAARYHILAGQPRRAIETLRRSADTLYPGPVAVTRLHLEAIARFQLGEDRVALALLGDDLSSAKLREEMHWRRRDWQQLAAMPLASPGRLDAVGQTRVLRRAIALAMLGDERGLAMLKGRYALAFARLPSAGAFQALTEDSGSVGTDRLALALASLPVAPATSAEVDLLELAPPPVTRRPGPRSPRD